MVNIRAKAILPSIPSNPKLFADKLDRGNKNIAQGIRRDFEKTVKTWTKKPKFFVRKERDANAIIWFAGTDNEIYGYVTLGTEAHRIAAKDAPRLLFQTGYNPKTQPGILSSKKGGKFGDFASVEEVQHPGTEARDFHKIIAERLKDKVVKEANRALREYLQASTRPAGR